MKRFVCGMLVVLLLCPAVGAASVPAVSAKSVVLMDADSGRVLYSKNKDEPRLIASITKIMTALVALESGHALDEVVTIRPEWTGIEGSSLYLKPGEALRLETLLYGLLLRSGNDAAHAVAEYCAGDMDAFVQAMNEKAAALGMTNTSFANPSGLNADDHFSSAYDMALLARACLQNQTMRDMVSTRSITLENRIFTNHNKLLWQYEGCIGLKTGYTEKAGRTLVSAAERDGMTLICVTLSDPNDWQDHAALFDYGFANFKRHTLVRSGELVCVLPTPNSLVPLHKIKADRDLYAALASGEEPTRKVNLPNSVSAYAAAGSIIGTVSFTAGGTELGQMELKLPHSISENIAPERTGIFQFFGR